METAEVVETMALPLDATSVVAGAGIIATGDAGGTLRLRRLGAQDPYSEQFAHAGGISSVVIQAEASIVVTAGLDGDVRVWDLESGEQLYTMISGSGTIQSLDVSRDGSRLLVLRGDAAVGILALDVGALIEIARDQVTRSLTGDECARYLGGPCEG